MRVRAAEGGLEIALEFQSPLPDLISSDPIRIRQILINLVGNAIKFTESGSVKVLVSFSEKVGVEHSRRRYWHRPEQRGPSATVPPVFAGRRDHLKTLRRQRTWTSHQPATGFTTRRTHYRRERTRQRQLLYIDPACQRRLRIATSSAAPRTDYGAMTSSVSVGQLDIRVLVVDDRRDVRFLVQVFVNKLGGKTVLCENGEEAIARIRSDQSEGLEFDIVLMDMQMPVMDGITAVRQLRSQGYNRPVIALTANAMNSDREICMQAGFNDYLSKPVDANRLTEVLRKYCARD